MARGIAVALLGLAVVASTPSPAFAGQNNLPNPTDPRRPARVEQWLKAVLHHRPGEPDDAANLVASWSDADMRTLQTDLNILVQITRNPGGVGPQFEIPMPGQSKPALIRYAGEPYHRMEALACAAGGNVAVPGDKLPRFCQELGSEMFDADLQRLAGAVNTARIRGDHDNYILRRGALLHADIALLVLARRPREPPNANAARASVRLAMSDGQGAMENDAASVQWGIAQMLLDRVIPPGADVVAPARDDMVRQWYVAMAAWMQQTQQYLTDHLDRARALFPRDTDILFLSGCERETYAGAAIQSAVRSASMPFGVDFKVSSDQTELRAAEGFFRAVLVSKPGFDEARLHLGHVLLLRGRAADAVMELQQAMASLTNPILRYYAELLDGAALEATGQFDRARASYEKAAELSPSAQSPRLALSALARRRGDRAGALRALHDVFTLPTVDPNLDDPWWTYAVFQARAADVLLGALWRPFLEQAP